MERLVNWKDIKRLLRIMDENKLIELSIEEGETKITLKKAQSPVMQGNMPVSIPQVFPTQSIIAPAEVTTSKVPEASEVKKLYEIKSPLVGTFYRCPKPGAAPFVEVKDKITKGQTLCIIEAMKVMNEIKSDVDGVIVEICVKNGEPVDYGKVIFKVEITQ